MDDLYDLGARAILTTGHPRLPPLTAATARSCPDSPRTARPARHLPADPHPGRPAHRRRRDLRRHHRHRAAAASSSARGERLSFIFTGAAAASASCLLLSRPKVVADEAGVTVVNLTTRRRLDWAEIAAGQPPRPATPGSSSTSATAPACPRWASSPASPRQQAIARRPRPARPRRDPRHGPSSDITADSSGVPLPRPAPCLDYSVGGGAMRAPPPPAGPRGPAGPPATRGVTPSSNGRIVL